MDYSMDDTISISRREREMNSDKNLLLIIDTKLAFTDRRSKVNYVILEPEADSKKDSVTNHGKA
jgi:hypothetical protein